MYKDPAGSGIITSASDLVSFAKCEFGFARSVDVLQGRIEAVDVVEDEMLQRTAKLGNEHETRVLERYRAEGIEIVEVARPQLTKVADAAAETLEALRRGAGLVYQAVFSAEGFVGYADFLVRQPDGSYQVQDTKLARTTKVSALLQLAAYAEQLEQNGIAVHPMVRLILGDGTEPEYRLQDIAPVFRHRWAAMRSLIARRAQSMVTLPIAWGDSSVTPCGHCEWCESEILAADDLFQIANIRGTQRSALRAAGLVTMTELAESIIVKVAGMTRPGLHSLREQARQQLVLSPEAGRPSFAVVDPAALSALPQPNAGDIFFDFEGDPLYSEATTEDDEALWGLDYLFGFVDAGGDFIHYDADTLKQERLALEHFIDDVAARLEKQPDLHVYHYASYERTHLLSLAARHSVREAQVDDLLRKGVLVDLYPIVRRALRIGDKSYSLKVIEKIYRTAARTGEVKTAAASIDEYVRYCGLRDEGKTGEADAVLQQIQDYNEDDCRSTHELRDWMLRLAEENDVTPAPATVDDQEGTGSAEETAVGAALRELAGDPLDPERSSDQRAYGIAAAATGYHRRENKRYWQEHFARLADPIDEWADTRGVLEVESAEVVVDWRLEGKWKKPRRDIVLRGTWSPGSRAKVGETAFAVFDFTPGLEFGFGSGEYPRQRPAVKVTLAEVADDHVIVQEGESAAGTHATLPLALTPSSEINSANLVGAVEEWGNELVACAPAWPDNSMTRLLRRVVPLPHHSEHSPAETFVGPLVESLRSLSDSYLAVQGPPGTGKTYSGAHVIHRLVTELGWKVGVVSQSHSTVENMLKAIAEAGLAADAMAKKPKDRQQVPVRPWQWLTKAGSVAAFLSASGGCVLGGTAWTFANTNDVGRRQLDLLVVDEAGQFSLGMTIPAAMAAQRVLLLGDPQQLPQVSQGSHPEPVNVSALGFVSDRREVLPPELGFFLPLTRRMSAALTRSVSDLSYEGALAAHPQTDERALEGVQSGLHLRPIDHVDCTTSSVAEAAEVVSLVEEMLGRQRKDPQKGDGPLAASDIIVISPYNAQVELIEQTLASRGIGGVEVGTVDRFQGKEGVIAIVSLAASSPADIPRGMEFLLMKNRLNVAISRAQWAAYLIYSPALADHLPPTPTGVARLSAFIQLLEGAVE